MSDSVLIIMGIILYGLGWIILIRNDYDCMPSADNKFNMTLCVIIFGFVLVLTGLCVK